jgi:FtsZ-interacting cell division protein ZipA
MSTIAETTKSVSSKLSMFTNKESIRTIIEIILLIAVCYYFNKKHSKTFKHLEEMSQRLEDQEDMIEKQNNLIKDLTEKVEMLMTQKQVRQHESPQYTTAPPSPPKVTQYTTAPPSQKVTQLPQYEAPSPPSQKMTQLPQYEAPPPSQKVTQLPQYEAPPPPPSQKVTQLPQYEAPPQQVNKVSPPEVRQEPSQQVNKVSPPEVSEAPKPISSVKKRARSLESSPSVEILDDDDFENELKSELDELS